MENQENNISNYINEIDDFHSDINSINENLDSEEFIKGNSKVFDFAKDPDDYYKYISGQTNPDLNNLNNDIEKEVNNFENKTIIYEKLFQTTKKKKFKPENIRIKIKVHYHKFIYSFFNDLIKYKFPKKKCFLRKIPHSITKVVSKNANINLMNTSLEQFLSQNVSSTFNCDPKQNLKNIEKLKKLLSNEEEKKFLSITYKDFYEKYYLNSKNIDFNFTLSSSTQFFCDYLKTLDENERNNVDNIAKNHFIQYFLDGNDNFSFKINNELNVNNGVNKKHKFNIIN